MGARRLGNAKQMNEHKYQEIFIWQKGQENAAKSQEEEFFKIVFLSGLQGGAVEQQVWKI